MLYHFTLTAPAYAILTQTPGARFRAAGAVVLALAPYFVYPLFLTKLLCMALFAIAFNLLIGGSGLLSFGHAAFFGGAAYIAAEAAKVWGVPFEAAVLAGTATAAALGLLFGLIAIRRQGLYFAMITLALAQGVYFLALRLPFTHSEDGLQAVPRGRLFGVIDLHGNLAMYYTVAVIFLLGYLFVWRVWNSPFGRVLNAIKDNRARTISLGYAVDRYLLLNFVLSAALSGVAGSLKALSLGLATLNDVDWSTSGDVVLMVLLGGLGTMFGPVVGAALIVTMDDYLAGSAIPVPVVIGLVFIGVILMFRRGILGEILHRSRRRAERRMRRSPTAT